MIRHILIVLLLAISSGVYAQNKNSIASRFNSQKADSVKKPRILKQWTLSQDFTEEANLPIDTAFSLYQRTRITDKYSPVNAYLGNYGLPFYQINFFDRITDPDKFLYSYYYPLMHLPSNALFMNTQVPYTEFDWSFAGQRPTSEQTLRVRHSQNINRFLNFGLIYDIVFSLGQYNYQRAADKTFTFYTSYTGVKYKLYFSAGLNNILSYENGGILKTSDLNQPNTLDVPTNLGALNKASSRLKDKNLLLVQRYTFSSDPTIKSDSTGSKHKGFFGLSGTFSHIFELESVSRTYKDLDPNTGFYDTVYISHNSTADSLFSRMIKNTLRFDFSTDETRKFRLGGGFGIRNEILLFAHIIPVPYTYNAGSLPSEWHLRDNVLVGKLFNNIGEKFRWFATGELTITGYRSGDFTLDGEIDKSFDLKKGRASWLLTGSIMNRQPAYWYEQWGGNNFKWDNNFNKEFRIDFGTVLKYPARKTELRFNYAVIKNYVDFDTTAHPAQYSGSFSVAAISLRNELRAWKFHLTTDAIVEKSTNTNVLDLPLVTIKSAGYFEHLFKFAKTGGRLNTQLGADIIYHTLYHPYAYMPATGRYYRQDLETLGDYPFINVFLNLKIKRTRIFLMFDHINSGTMGYKYFMVPTYPMNVRMFRYGFSWTFYD
jgi:hypothetical protein